ncbi:MAG: hypothetical protein KDI30_09720 [Pseudomonadales bacterium]|nr:hypothetical protein [Pseudomonadales bacterium]
MRISSLEVDVDTALNEMLANVPLVMSWVKQHSDIRDIAVQRFWHAPANTHIYHTVAAVEGAGQVDLDTVAEVFLHANQLESQPWYPAFISGRLQPLASVRPLPTAVHGAYTGEACFDFGLPQPRYYRQLIADIRPAPSTRMIALRSIEGTAEVTGAVRAYTLSPSADVFSLDGNRLLWHHIVTVYGAALLPPKADYLLMRLLRILHLDFRERQTYRDEAKAFQQCFHRGVFSALRPPEQ